MGGGLGGRSEQLSHAQEQSMWSETCSPQGTELFTSSHLHASIIYSLLGFDLMDSKAVILKPFLFIIQIPGRISRELRHSPNCVHVSIVEDFQKSPADLELYLLKAQSPGTCPNANRNITFSTLLSCEYADGLFGKSYNCFEK